MDAFQEAARMAVRVLTRDQIDQLAQWIEGNPEGSSLMAEVTTPPVREVISNVLGSMNLAHADMRTLASASLRALADGYAMGLAEQRRTRVDPT